MKITRRQLSRLINENLGRALDEGSRHTGGVQQGATVWLKGDPDRGKGVVRGKYKDPRMGHVISVQWEETGRTSSHIPSAITTSQEIATTWERGRYPQSEEESGKAGEMTSQAAISHAVSLRDDGLSFVDFSGLIVDKLNLYDEWLENKSVDEVVEELTGASQLDPEEHGSITGDW